MRAAQKGTHFCQWLFPPDKRLRWLRYVPHRFRKFDGGGVAGSKPLDRCDDLLAQRRIFSLASINHYARLAVRVGQAVLEGLTLNPDLAHWLFKMPGKIA